MVSELTIFLWYNLLMLTLKNISFLSSLLIGFIIGCISIIIFLPNSLRLGYNSRFSCAQLGVDYLEYTKKRYPDLVSKYWKDAINVETELVNICSLDPRDRANFLLYLKESAVKYK